MEGSASNAAAWWGAIVATIVLVWDIVKWSRQGARLVISAYGDRKRFVSGVGALQGEVVLVTIKNRGRAPTTISGMGMVWFESLWRRLLKRSHSAYLVLVESPKPIPHILPPGEEWSGWFQQTPELREFAATGIVVLQVSSSHRNRDQRAVVQFNKVRP